MQAVSLTQPRQWPPLQSPRRRLPGSFRAGGSHSAPPFLAPDAALSLGVLPKLYPHLYSILPN